MYIEKLEKLGVRQGLITDLRKKKNELTMTVRHCDTREVISNRKMTEGEFEARMLLGFIKTGQVEVESL